MSADAHAEQPPTVFISYAHESDALQDAVKTLDDWLTERGCTVLTDHAYTYQPPAEGWQAWMQDCIDRAKTVLVVCTPTLKTRYEKNAPLGKGRGRGATFEGAIVTQHIYDAAMRNTKFYPVLPDGGNENDIPLALRPWWNGHWFPSGNEGILRLIIVLPPEPPIPKGSPYPGLRAFTRSEAGIFFGRRRETNALVAQLGNPGCCFVAVVGASGTGRSSLVYAGLLPRLEKGAIEGSAAWQVVSFQPGFHGDNPFLALADALRPLLPGAGRPIDLAKRLANNPASITREVDRALSRAPTSAQLVLFVDQLEELFTQAAQVYREGFVDLLASAAEHTRVRVLARSIRRETTCVEC